MVLTHLCCCSCSYCKLPEASDWLFLMSKWHSFCYYCGVHFEGSDSRTTTIDHHYCWFTIYIYSEQLFPLVSILQVIVILFYLKEDFYMEIYILFLDFDLTEWILSSVICFMNHLHTIRIYCIFAQMQHDSLHDSFIFKASTLYQRHLSIKRNCTENIFLNLLPLMRPVRKAYRGSGITSSAR